MRDKSKLLQLLVATCAIVSLAASIARLSTARGEDDPDWAPDSTFIAQGPIASQSMVEASLAEKAQLEQQEQQARETTVSQPPSKNPNYTPPNVPDPLPPTGILERGSLPSGWRSLYRVENMWARELPDGDFLRAYAGLMLNDRSRMEDYGVGQGMIALMHFSPDEASPGGGTYLTPYKCGPVRFTIEEGDQLLLTAPSSSAWFRFHVATRTWIGHGVVAADGSYLPQTPPCASAP